MNQLVSMYDIDIKNYAKSYFSYLNRVLNEIDLVSVEKFVEYVLSARANNKTIFFIGNGGSASTASHFANDFSIGVNNFKPPLKALCLADNVAIVTAIANDYGYDEIFSRQLKILGQPGDILVGISASGNSKNIINAIEVAGDMGLMTVGITGFDGGAMKSKVDLNIHVPSGNKEYGPVEDAHMILDHLIGSYLMRRTQEELE
ncbi:SIS domain-containing protein [Polynucleobacter sp. Adler-ghost]|uniref:D-sedoheptulose-7-phosphate isomerase n=1 Tax=Polynucleobacter sp. Adler-ghost TaxID=2770234 RepID=UPI001BFEE107|nr:SIS domain-containing protein [Polynucleobacter sp. Adler-ghost]QWE31051.1 SIS domain-containing protein [Polynucleobacter sp. Adler-ghost]